VSGVRTLRLAWAALSFLAAGLAAEEPRAAEDCEAAVVRRPGDAEAWLCFEVAAQSAARYPDVVRRLERLRAARAGDPFPTLALGRIQAGRSAAGADALLVSAAEEFRRRADVSGEAQALSSLARLHTFVGRDADARRARDDLARLAERTSSPDVRLQVVVLDAHLAQKSHDYGRAWSLVAGVDPRALEAAPRAVRRSALSTLGYVAWITGRTSESIAAYRKLQEMLREAGDHFGEASVGADLLSILSTPGFAKPAERRRAAEETLAAAEASGNRYAEALALAYLADMDGPGPASSERVARALEIARESESPVAVRMVLRAKALYGGATDPDGAEAAFHEALSEAEAGMQRDEIARTLVVRSRMLWTSGPRADAIGASTAALDAAESTRDEQPDSLTRARRFSQWGRVYYELAGHLVSGDLLSAGAKPSDDDVALAFATLERMRARVLLDELDASRTSAGLFAAGPAERRRDDALKELASLTQKFRNLATGDPERARLRTEIERRRVEEADLRRLAALENPSFAALRAPVFPSLAEVRGALAPDEALLVYTLADASPEWGPTWGCSSRVLVVTRRSVETRPVPDQLASSQSIMTFDGLLELRSGDEAPGAVRLYDDFLRPALERLPSGVRRLVIVPDRVLFALPFAALRAAPDAASVGETFDLSVVSSATLWFRERALASAAPRGVLALVDPGSPPGGSPEVPGAPPRAGDAGPLPPLRLARREGETAVRRIGLGSRLLAGSDAAEAAVRGSAAADYRVLHFAAHALLDDAQPDRSAIVLAPGAAEDGLLHLSEIAGLGLRGGVVVVSGCRSAGGFVAGGEGPMGLARAFFQAGARAVVGSLFTLRDDEAAAFFDRFYAHLASGASISGAVRLAQRDRRRAGAPAAAWAGIVALGDGSAVPFPGGTGGRWPMYLGLGIGAGLAIAVTFWRRARRGP
jgi:CHAT domain-containing protein